MNCTLLAEERDIERALRKMITEALARVAAAPSRMSNEAFANSVWDVVDASRKYDGNNQEALLLINKRGMEVK